MSIPETQLWAPTPKLTFQQQVEEVSCWKGFTIRVEKIFDDFIQGIKDLFKRIFYPDPPLVQITPLIPLHLRDLNALAVRLNEARHLGKINEVPVGHRNDHKNCYMIAAMQCLA